MESIQFDTASIADERIMRTARIVARAANALPDGSSREAIERAHRFLGHAITAHLFDRRGGYQVPDYKQEQAEALAAAETWALAALKHSPAYAGYADRDPRFAERIVADDAGAADAVAGEDYA
jgi:hypothetical protein